jgi:hypothetical protein
LREFGLAELGSSSSARGKFCQAFDVFSIHGNILADDRYLKTLSLLQWLFINTKHLNDGSQIKPLQD